VRGVVREYIRPEADVLGGILDEMVPAPARAEPGGWYFCWDSAVVAQCLFYGRTAIAAALMGEEAFQKAWTSRREGALKAASLGDDQSLYTPAARRACGVVCHETGSRSDAWTGEQQQVSGHHFGVSSPRCNGPTDVDLHGIMGGRQSIVDVGV